MTPRAASTSSTHRQGRWRATAVALAFVVAAAHALPAQTVIKPPKNKYTPEQDVQIGREAAAEVRKQYPIINDERIASYLDRLGRKLVAAAPPELNNPVFEYSFTPVNLKEINAFALPGGPMFVNRGMFDAAKTEGEVAGVMAHELSHVLLRHGTANATKAQGFQFGALAGAIAGAIVGGGWGEVISQGSQFGLGTWLLKYSREYEKQADLLGAQMMARAGYDPRALAHMFETIERESKGQGGPQWMSDHPDPGNRSGYIAAEAAKLTIAPSSADARGFDSVKSAFAGLPPAKSSGEVARKGGSGGTGGGGSTTTAPGTLGRPVPAPAAQYRTEHGGKLFQVDVPSNWHALAATNNIKYVPENAYGQVNGESVVTHGVELGVARASSQDLREATAALTNSLAEGNPDLRRAGDQRQVPLAQRTAIATPMLNRSALGGDERILLYTTFLTDGNLFYYVTVVPDADAGQYASTFDRIGRSIRLNDGS